ncbi:uncharacterized protein LOC129947921 [Eupeodes corollae]|uniref:uncharacterized protein LOC129947921 n=1 Tax=Eupeodes corollae TaxID=290404 RepID=UPI002490C135|nr:uncharacterized protein LOC129947921 [Eupeodes corollae]
MKCVWILFSILFGILTFVNYTSARKSETILHAAVEDYYSYSSTDRAHRASKLELRSIGTTNSRSTFSDHDPDVYSYEDESSIEEPPTERPVDPHRRRRITHVRRRHSHLLFIEHKHHVPSKPANVVIYPRPNILKGHKHIDPHLGMDDQAKMMFRIQMIICRRTGWCTYPYY